MAHIMAGCQGSRGPVTRLAGKRGGRAFIQGWHCGVEVFAGQDKAGDDCFDVYGTGGSNGAVERVLLGTVKLVSGKPTLIRPKK